MYWWAWKGRSWKVRKRTYLHVCLCPHSHTHTPIAQDPIVFPEYMNVLGAALYLWSAALYPTESGPTDATTLKVHRIETAAAGVEWLACVGWFITWHLTYLRVPGRGYTLDDPDVWALITIFGGSTCYMLYNIRCFCLPTCMHRHCPQSLSNIPPVPSHSCVESYAIPKCMARRTRITGATSCTR